MTIEQVKEEAKKRFDKELTDEQARAILKNFSSEELLAQELEDVAGGAYYQLHVCPNSKQWGTINIYNTEELSPQELEKVTGGANKVKITYVDYIERNRPKSPELEPHVITYEEIKDWHLTHERIEDWIKDWLDAQGSKELSEE